MCSNDPPPYISNDKHVLKQSCRAINGQGTQELQEEFLLEGPLHSIIKLTKGAGKV